MSFDISSIRTGTQSRPPRVLLHGTEKVGKSTFASQWPNTVFIPIKGEEGIDALNTSSFPVCSTFEDVMDAMRVLSTEEHGFSNVCIDSVSALEPIIWEKACRDKGWTDIEAPGYGKGYVAALEYWWQIQTCLDFLRSDKGMSSILIGHVTVRQFNDPLLEPYDVYELDVNKKAAAQLKRWSDSILFVNRKTFTREKDTGFNKKTVITSGGNEPMLYTQKQAAHEGGGRGVYGQLPYELPLNYDAFIAAVSAATK